MWADLFFSCCHHLVTYWTCFQQKRKMVLTSLKRKRVFPALPIIPGLFTKFQQYLGQCMKDLFLQSQVGGDGLFQEVLNGLLSVRGAGGEAGQLAAHLRLGHIPAGSTDAVAFSLNGTRSQATAALHIALGDRHVASDSLCFYGLTVCRIIHLLLWPRTRQDFRLNAMLDPVVVSNSDQSN